MIKRILKANKYSSIHLLEGPSTPLAFLRISFAFISWQKYCDYFLYHRKLDKILEKSIEIFGQLNFTQELFVALIYLFICIFFQISFSGMLFGFKSKFFTCCLGIIAFSIYFIDPHHHTFLLSCILIILSFSNIDKSFSIDSRGNYKSVNVSYAPLAMLCVLNSSVYFWSATDKLFSIDFLSGNRLEALFWQYWPGSSFEQTSLFDLSLVAISLVIIIIQYLLAFGLWNKKLFFPIVIIGFILHIMMYLALPIGPFSIIMWLLYYVFYLVRFKSILPIKCK
ncbi:HTTM domain-containing protein [Prochlorococcus sp. AH-716-I05]|nr:HTTM domain-containing protein [Prochlorococcus sp. AH-716-I05]